jgi:hypothetical protein
LDATKEENIERHEQRKVNVETFGPVAARYNPSHIHYQQYGYKYRQGQNSGNRRPSQQPYNVTVTTYGYNRQISNSNNRVRRQSPSHYIQSVCSLIVPPLTLNTLNTRY